MILFKENEFKVTPGAYLGVIAHYKMRRLWWVLFFPLAFFIAGIFNWRFALVGLIVLMLVYPFLLTTALMTDAMRPEIIRRASARFVESKGDTLYLYKELKNGADDSASRQLIETITPVEINVSGKYLKIKAGPEPHNFILLPTDIVESVE